jgi:hypothetical protein
MPTKTAYDRIRPSFGYDLTEATARGIPVLAEFKVEQPDKSVGLFSKYVEDVALYNLRGYRLKWLEAKMTRDDYELLHEQLLA